MLPTHKPQVGVENNKEHAEVKPEPDPLAPNACNGLVTSDSNGAAPPNCPHTRKLSPYPSPDCLKFPLCQMGLCWYWLSNVHMLKALAYAIRCNHIQRIISTVPSSTDSKYMAVQALQPVTPLWDRIEMPDGHCPYTCSLCVHVVFTSTT
ncbi:hypothetical protein J6590_027788 [Homalodisca vitripennis]|nr:hypothetical protein J6590_027788 [Homalodisca vitripennis]